MTQAALLAEVEDLERRTAELRAKLAEATPPPLQLRLCEPESKPRHRRPPRQSPAVFSTAVDAFRAAWRRRFSREYIITPADRGMLGRVLRNMTPGDVADLPALYQAYLSTADGYAHAMGYPLRLFCAQINRYRVKPADRRKML